MNRQSVHQRYGLGSGPSLRRWERHFDRLSDVLDDAFPIDQGDAR